MISSPPLRNPSSSFCLGSGFAKQCVSEDIIQDDHKVCPFWWYSHWSGNFNSWVFRAISVAEDIKMGFAIAIAMAAVCQAMSHWRLHPEEWRHPDEHDKLCLFDDMGIGMAIQRIKMSFFLSSNLCCWRHQDDHRLFDDVYFCVNELCLFFKSMWHVYIHWNNNTCFWREMCRWIFQDGHDELCLFQSHGPWPGILYKILKGKNHLRARTDESCLYLFKYFCWLYNFL